MTMSMPSRHEVQRAFARRYRQAPRKARSLLLDEFCALTGYNRKYAIALLRGGPLPLHKPASPPRGHQYGPDAEKILVRIWEAADYPWSLRLKAILPLWLPWAIRHFLVSPTVEQQLRRMSARTMDRLLRAHKKEVRARRFGRTKPGTLLKHHIPIKTDAWDVTEAGFVEVDSVAHCGECAYGEFANSINLTDIHTTWTESRAVLGKSEQRVCAAIDELRSILPFPLRGLDSDNGSEFINHHVYKYCQQHAIVFTRGRPYKKNDNAHIEQKNWTHVRKILGWARFDTPEVLDAVNDLYRNELRLWMNFFQPTIKLIEKVRVGARLKRRYDKPKTPLDRVLACPEIAEETKTALREQRTTLDPFVLAAKIEEKLDVIRALAIAHHTPEPKKPGKGIAVGRHAPDLYVPPSTPTPQKEGR